MADVVTIDKGGFNAEFRYKFRGVDQVIDAVGPILRQHGVLVLPTHIHIAHRDISTSGGKPARECTAIVTYTIVGPRGDTLTVMSAGEGMDLQDKGTAKAMSVALRILFLQALVVPTGDPDPDQGGQSPTRANKRQPRARVEKPAPEPVTDPAWLADMQDRIGEALNQANLTELWAQLIAAKRAGKVSTVDAAALQVLFGERGKAFNTDTTDTDTTDTDTDTDTDIDAAIEEGT